MHKFIYALCFSLFLGCISLSYAAPQFGHDEYGRNPSLVEPDKKPLPTVKVADAIGWPMGATPTAASGFRVQPFATDLDHPRWVHVLPNGDVLVAETNAPPKPKDGQGIKGWVMKQVMKKAGAGPESPNRITLLRDTNGDGVSDEKHTFLANLNSPFGMALVGDTLFVAYTDAVVKFPYKAGETKITAAPGKVGGLPPRILV